MAMEPPAVVALRIANSTVLDQAGKAVVAATWTLALTEIQTMIKTALCSVVTTCPAGAGTGTGTVT